MANGPRLKAAPSPVPGGGANHVRPAEAARSPVLAALADSDAPCSARRVHRTVCQVMLVDPFDRLVRVYALWHASGG